jgi:D-glycero-alpha-D-manno-heptose-7-phosphate kinase
MNISAKTPCRVDLAGGTLDIWPLYLFHDNAVTVNFAVDLYTTCSVEERPDGQIHLRSDDLKGEDSYPSLETLRGARHHRLPLAAEVLKFFTPAGGLNVRTHSESPAGAGIGGSSALLIATCSALNKVTGAGYSIERIREIAQNIEARIIRVPTGCQDYYSAMYGGVSAIELRPDGLKRFGLDVPAAELDSRVVLAYTGAPRNSGINNWEVTKAHIDGEATVHRNFETIAAIAHAMRRALPARDWNEVARLLREEWSHRKTNAPGISTPMIERLIEVTRRKGVRAAKVCGAGGGGCVLFLAEPDAKQRVSELIASEGATVLNVKVAPRGVRIRTAA